MTKKVTAVKCEIVKRCARLRLYMTDVYSNSLFTVGWCYNMALTIKGFDYNLRGHYWIIDCIISRLRLNTGDKPTALASHSEV